MACSEPLHSDRARCWKLGRLALVLGLVGGAEWPAWAAGPAGVYTYSCVDNQGRRLTSDRPIPECEGRTQRLLGSDGTLRGTLEPAPSVMELEARKVREAEKAAEAARLAEVVRRDRLLMSLYRDESAYKAVREIVLNGLRDSMRRSDRRVQVLGEEKAKLAAERQGAQKQGGVSPALQGRIDANEAAYNAMLIAQGNQKAELDRITSRYEAELNRLRRLWAGAEPGSLGPLDTPASP